MNTIVLIAAIVLVIQGIYILLQPLPPYYRSFGLLTVFLAGLGFLAYQLSVTGDLIYSPELGVVIVQGTIARVGLSVLVIGLALIAGLGWRIARVSSGWSGAIPWFLATGALIGVLTLFKIRPVNPNELPPFRIYVYNVWWPVLSVWVSLCVVESVISVVKVKQRLIRALAATTVIAVLALWGLHQPHVSANLWWAVGLVLALPATAGMAAILAFKPYIKKKKLRYFVIAIAAVVGLISAIRFIRSGDEPSLAWLIWLIMFLAVVLLAAGRSLVALHKKGSLHLPEDKSTLKDYNRRAIIGAILFAIAFSIAAFFYNVTDLDRAIPLATFFIAWAVLGDFITSQGILYALKHSLGSSDRFKAFLKNLWNRLKAILLFLPNGIRNFFKDTSTPGAVMHFVLGLLLLIALSEIPNAGKTVVIPFKTTAVTNQEGFGQQIADQIIGNLALIGHQLHSDIIILSDTKGAEVRSVGANVDVATIEVAKSSPINVGGVSIPIMLFFWPVQQPVRALLNVEVIGGSIHADKFGYTLLANSTTGNAWVVNYTDENIEPASDATVADNTTIDKKIEVAEKSGEKKADQQPGRPIPPEALRLLTAELAFEIVAADPNIQQLGMTQSWEAFKSYKLGLEDFREFQRGKTSFTPGRFDKITSAIGHLRKAVQMDPNFALAHYRLGIALQDDGQPGAAASAFRTSRKANPNFMPAVNALAYSLYFNVGTTQKEASWLWQQVIHFDKSSQQELAMAYSGLGRIYLDKISKSNATSNVHHVLLAFYYFMRAARIYDRMPPQLRASSAVKQAEGGVLNELGVLFSIIGGLHVESKGEYWHCYHALETGDDTAGPDETSVAIPRQISTFIKAAFRYHMRALSLQPDDPILRCNAASEAYALGNVDPMAKLEVDTQIRTWRAEYNKKPFSHNFHEVLREYETAINLDQSNIIAMNNFAYTFWEWRRDVGHIREPGPAMIDLAHKAEAYARKAVQLSMVRGDPNQTLYISTLAEVLLAQARSQEAIQLIKRHYNTLVPRHASFNEIRWDLALAYRCAAEKDRVWLENHDSDEFRNPERIEEYLREAQKWIDKIRESEQNREYQSYSGDKSLLENFHSLKTCTGDPQYSLHLIHKESEATYLLNPDITYDKYDICNWVGVQSFISKRASDDRDVPLQLHVWGGGANRRVAIEDGYGYAFLTSSPHASHDYYFVQLERLRNSFDWPEPISPVYSINTYDDCEKNQISLTFFPRTQTKQ